MKWVKGTLCRGLLHRRMSNDKKKLVRSVDVDCVGVLNRSTLTRYNSNLFRRLRRWEALQPVVALSTMESDNIAITKAGLETIR